MPREPGALTGQQRLAIGSKAQLGSSLFPSNYLKLREVSLTLDVPASVVHRFWSGARYVRVTLSGRNLLIFTPYPGTDPETTTTPTSLANSSPGEFQAYPQSRSFWLGFDLGF